MSRAAMYFDRLPVDTKIDLISEALDISRGEVVRQIYVRSDFAQNPGFSELLFDHQGPVKKEARKHMRRYGFNDEDEATGDA